MIHVFVWVETLALAALVFVVARRARPARATNPRLIAIATLLAVQALILDASVLSLLPATWQAGQGSAPGLVWLTQAARVALLLPAFALWYRISRDDLAARGRRGLLAIALVALAFGGGIVPVLAMVGLLWMTGRSAWSRELSGWRRFVTLIVGPLLLVLVTLVPYGLERGGRLDAQIVAFSDPWQTDLVGGSVPRPLQVEMALTRPLDRIVRALLDLLRAHLVVLSLRALTMPMRLYGMSLKRRFVVNYFFVRSIPSVLGIVTLLVVGYVGLGVHKAGRARGEFEKTLARAQAAGAALLEDPRVAPGRPGTAVALASARRWLGPDGTRAHLVLRRWEGSPRREIAPEFTSGTPPGLLRLAPPAGGDRRFEGLLEDGAGLYLVARRADAETTRTLDVCVPLDSLYLASVADTIGARITLTLDRGFSSDRRHVRFTSDSTSLPPVKVASHASAPGRREGLFMGRAYLPVGDWGVAWSKGAQGGIALELRTTRSLLLGSLRDVPGWLVSNVVMLGLLLGLTTLIGIIEGVAVRSGKGILKSLEEEVAALREAVTRFGAGELGHRIPVRGHDELSVLAGSFNEMAANLERQRGELIEKERLEEDLEVARSIQRRFLPQRSPDVPGLAVAGISVPSREVGGDLFHYARLPGDRLAIALGDVSGKSVPAALIMSNVMSALRTETQHETEIGKSLERINRLLVEQIEPGRFVTLFYGIVDPGARIVRYTSAGHNPVLKVSAAGDVDWLREGGVPLGVQVDGDYPSAEAPIEPGDTLVAYSDGVTEAEGTERDGRTEMFGEERLAGIARSMRTQPVEAVLEGVLAAVREFAAGRPQADDITLVVVRRE